MALFPDSQPVYTRGPRPARRAGMIAVFVAVIVGLILAIAPAPYVIEKPGPAYNTLGSSDVVGTSDEDSTMTPLIDISGETVYPTEGSLDLLTVSRLGNPENRPNWLSVFKAWLTPSEAVVPIDQAYPPNVSTEQQEQQSTAAMIDSQNDAIAAALTHLDYSYPSEVTVMSIIEDSPAEGSLEPEDQVISVNGVAVESIQALRDALKSGGAGNEATLGVVRDGEEIEVQVTPEAAGEAVVVGVNVKTEYDFPFDVRIQLDKVGGPSAGMMFALGIIDKLTPGALQGGEDVAGTGTIDPTGAVGPIGGIRQKLYGAEDAGAEWFLAPSANCDEVTGHIPDGLTVFSVETLDDSLAALEAIRTGEGTEGLATCPAS
ncbi:MAG TPA: PDZ domain-containing protein [Glaciibacter sp.]|nr:PDZ domain-containing protein [Glaciibacter sp.]